VPPVRYELDLYVPYASYRCSNNLKYTYKFMYSMHILVHVGMHCFSQVLHTVCCSSKLYAHTNVCKPKLINIFDNKAAAQIGTNARARGLMPDCWLEVSLHPEGPATGQLDQDFPLFSLVPEQMLSWYPNSTLHCMLPMQPSQW
jgi:hypothetical protein